MKKNILVVSLIIILIVGIFLINIVKREKKENISTNEKDEVSEMLRDKNIITSSSLADKLYKEDFDILVKNSDAVIKGKVLSVNYEAI